jgi:hypothetical protein
MRILFSMRHPGALRNFSSTLQELARRSHQIHLVFSQQDKLGDGRLLWELTQNFPNITYGEVSKKTPRRFWLGLARAARFSIDYVRYFTPEYANVVSLKERAAARAPAPIRWIGKVPLARTRAGQRLLANFLLAVERAIPADQWVTDLIDGQKPDAVLVTPLVDIGSDQVDYIKSARYLGIRSGLAVHSWDNLTNKGLIRVQPDHVYVWNDAQKTEAVTMHGTRPDDVVVTGAMVYDQWFERRPSTTREEFCRHVGLDPARPIFLYLGSSQFIAPEEINFIECWIKAVRSAPDPRVRTAGILVRPHPENLQPWQRIDDLQLENVVVWPRGGANPVDAMSKNGFFDSMYHSAGAVGINTSAQIECGVVGRPVFSVRTPEYHGTQEGTLHFQYLTSEGGGLLRLADDFDTHVRQLAQAIDDPEGTRRQVEGFVRAFTRPHGLDVKATPLIADAIERLGAMPRRVPERLPLHLYPLRALLYPVALMLKVTRRLTHLPRKRHRQLRPTTVTGTVVQALFKVLDWVFRFRPIKNFVKRYVVPRVIPRMGAPDTASEESLAVPRVLQKMAKSDRMIIVGPWLSEVGFEVLYWIPFLNWVKTYRSFDADRIVVVSRGGCGPWYRDIGAHYLDLFDYYTPEQYRKKHQERITEGQQNQRIMSEFDRDVLNLVRETLQVRHTELLHPMYMYRLFHPFWRSQASVNFIENFSAFKPLPQIDTSDLNGKVPDDYIAVRFYFNEAFPETDANRRFVAELVGGLAATTNVVMLNPGLRLDEHRDVEPAPRGRIQYVSHLMSPRTNLEVQTKIIARSRAFVGTYGGLSYLPPFYGVNSLAFYSDPRSFTVQHLELARRVFTGMKRGSYVALDVNDLETLRVALGEQHVAVPGLARRSAS